MLHVAANRAAPCCACAVVKTPSQVDVFADIVVVAAGAGAAAGEGALLEDADGLEHAASAADAMAATIRRERTLITESIGDSR